MGSSFRGKCTNAKPLRVNQNKNTIKMATKTKKTEQFEQTELFISAWEAEPSLRNIMSTAYKDSTAKMMSLKNFVEIFP